MARKARVTKVKSLKKASSMKTKRAKVKSYIGKKH
jgi:hypothetical protein